MGVFAAIWAAGVVLTALSVDRHSVRGARWFWLSVWWPVIAAVVVAFFIGIYIELDSVGYI